MNSFLENIDEEKRSLSLVILLKNLMCFCLFFFSFLQILSAAVACAAALPLEDTAEVKAAKAVFQASFDQAEKGEHANLAPKSVEASYLADSEDVAQAKADFTKACLLYTSPSPRDS